MPVSPSNSLYTSSASSSLKRYAYDALLLLSLPIVLVAGPIIASIGLVICKISHAFHLKKFKKSKIETSPGSIRKFKVMEKSEKTKELYVLIQERYKNNRDQWLRRLIPLYFGIEVILMLKKSKLFCCMLPSSSQVIETLSLGIPSKLSETLPPKPIGEHSAASSSTSATLLYPKAVSPKTQLWEQTLQESFSQNWKIEKESISSLTLCNVHNHIRLTMSHQSICIPFDSSSVDGGGVVAVVNTAKTGLKEDDDIQDAIQAHVKEAVSEHCWESSRDNLYKFVYKSHFLDAGKVRGCSWVAKDKNLSSTLPNALIQVVLPDPSTTHVNCSLIELKTSLRTAFSNVLRKAKNLGCSHLQLGISPIWENASAVSVINKHEWALLITAILEETINTLPLNHFVSHIVVVDEAKLPGISKIAKEHCSVMN